MSKTFKSEGVVLRALKYSETSLILDIYTEMHGIGSYIISGVRKSKSKSANVYQPMNIIDMVAYQPGNSLARIKEASYAYNYVQLNIDVIKSSIGIFFVDLLKASIKEKEANPALYQFIKNTLISLDQNPVHPLLPINYALGLTSYLGFQPSDNYGEASPYFDLQSGEFVENDLQSKYILNEVVSQYLYNAMIENNETRLDKEARKLVLDALMNYYRFHVNEFKELRSLPVLRTILS